MFLAAMPIALPYHICRLGEPCDKPCRFAAMYNNASFRVCRHARFCRPSDIREPRSRLPLGSSPSPSTPQKSSRHAAGLLNGTGMEGFGRSGHSPLGGEWLKLVELCQFVVLIMTSELKSKLSTKARVAQSMCGLAPRAQDDRQAIDHCARQPGVCARSDQNPDCR